MGIRPDTRIQLTKKLQLINNEPTINKQRANNQQTTINNLTNKQTTNKRNQFTPPSKLSKFTTINKQPSANIFNNFISSFT